MNNYIEEFRKFLEQEDMSKNTINSYISNISRFCEWLKKEYRIQQIDIVSYREIKNYREILLKKFLPQTVNQKLSSIKTFFKFLTNENIIKDNPAEKLKLQKIDNILTSQYLTRAEELIVLSEAKKIGVREECIVLLLLKTGIRVSEASNLLLADLIFEGENPSILIRDTKNNKSRYIPVSTDILDVVNRWLKVRNESRKIYHKRSKYLFISQRNERLTERGIQLILKKIGQKANINLYPIRFRATFANNLLQNTNIPINILASLMGHSNVITTQRYATPNMQDRRKYIEQLSEI